MDDLTQKLQALLSDPESMRNLSELAAMLQEPQSDAPPEQPAPAATPPMINILLMEYPFYMKFRGWLILL